MTQIRQDDEQTFYKELDEKKARSGCCTCQTLAIFFVLILVLFILALLFINRQISHGGTVFESPDFSVSELDVSSKLSGAKPDATGNVQIVLTSNDLNSLLNEGFSTQNFILKDIRASINGSNILIYGTLVKPISSKVVITVTPKASDDKIKLDINQITMGQVNVPNFLSKTLSNTISDLLSQKLASLYNNTNVTSVNLEPDKMTINGKTK